MGIPTGLCNAEHASAPAGLDKAAQPDHARYQHSDSGGAAQEHDGHMRTDEDRHRAMVSTMEASCLHDRVLAPATILRYTLSLQRSCETVQTGQNCVASRRYSPHSSDCVCLNASARN
jgi:hypothetical protein